MNKIRSVLVMFFIAFAMILSSCGSDADDEAGAGEDATEDTSGGEDGTGGDTEEEEEEEENTGGETGEGDSSTSSTLPPGGGGDASPVCASTEDPLLVNGEPADVVQDLIVVADGSGQDAVAELDAAGVSALEIDLTNAEELALLFNQRYCISNQDDGGLTGTDLASLIEESALWGNVASQVDLVEIEDGQDIEALVAGLIGNSIDAAPVHVMGALNHIGALPGVGADVRTDQPSMANSSEVTGDIKIGVVDTGFLGRSGVIKGVGLSSLFAALDNDVSTETCGASHGEFVASIIRQVQPDVEIHGVRAFPLRRGKLSGEGSCWSTDELGVLFATIRLEAAAAKGGFSYAAINYSLGAIPHTHSNGNQADTRSPKILEIAFQAGEAGAISFSEAVYAAAGNVFAALPVYPAAYENVIGIGTRSAEGQWVLWDNGTRVDIVAQNGVVPQLDSVDAFWVSHLVPGCHLLGIGTADEDEVVMWSGSSFASAVMTAYRSPSVWYTDLPSAMYPQDVSHVSTDVSLQQCERGAIED